MTTSRLLDSMREKKDTMIHPKHSTGIVTRVQVQENSEYTNPEALVDFFPCIVHGGDKELKINSSSTLYKVKENYLRALTKICRELNKYNLFYLIIFNREASCYLYKKITPTTKDQREKSFSILPSSPDFPTWQTKYFQDFLTKNYPRGLEPLWFSEIEKFRTEHGDKNAWNFLNSFDRFTMNYSAVVNRSISFIIVLNILEEILDIVETENKVKSGDFATE